MKKYLIRNVETKEVFEWAVAEMLEEINRNYSNEFTPYNEENYLDGWHEWVEGCGYYKLVDLLAEYHLLPIEVQNILLSFDENEDGYAECNRIIEELKPHGYTADFYLDAVLFDLVKIN